MSDIISLLFRRRNQETPLTNVPNRPLKTENNLLKGTIIPRSFFPRDLYYELSTLEKLPPELWLVIASYLTLGEKALLAMSTPFGAEHLSWSWQQLSEDRASRLLFLLREGRLPFASALCHACVRYHKVDHWEHLGMVPYPFAAYTLAETTGLWHHSTEAILDAGRLIVKSVSSRPTTILEDIEYHTDPNGTMLRCQGYSTCSHTGERYDPRSPQSPLAKAVRWALELSWRHNSYVKTPSLDCAKCSTKYAVKVETYLDCVTGWTVVHWKDYGLLNPENAQKSLLVVEKCALTQAQTPKLKMSSITQVPTHGGRNWRDLFSRLLQSMMQIW